MDKQENKQGVLSFNRSTGCYEGMLLVQVDAEIFRRMLLLAIEEDEAADLTDPQTWMRAIERVGNAAYWIGRPHVKITPVTHQTKLEEQKGEPAPKAGRMEEQDAANSLEQTLQAKARVIPPYRWEEMLLTPLSDELSRYEKRPIYQARHREHQVLDSLREAWRRGDFMLDDEAESQEKQHEEAQQTNVTLKLETVAEAVNGNRFH